MAAENDARARITWTPEVRARQRRQRCRGGLVAAETRGGCGLEAVARN
jgi:hypothetical protein